MSEGNKVLENNTDILHKISKEEYKDEWFIDKAILCYKAQNEKVFTFFRDNSQKDWLKKYNWCQRPDNTTMSLKRFDHIGNVHGHMSESLAEHYGLEQIDLNTFMHEFVAKLVEELNNLKEIEKSHQEENGKLRVELEQEKEKQMTLANKELFKEYVPKKIAEKQEKRISDLEFALMDMVLQFADESKDSINTMGLSALETAFSELDFDNPMPIKKVHEQYKKLAKQYFEKKAEEDL